jgi:AhpD family alkylhydroperoxidase
MQKSIITALIISGLFSQTGITGDEGVPRPTPLTRPLLKQWLESVKQREPRIPLPELTEEDKIALGQQSNSYEARLKHHYLNGIEASRGSAAPRQQDSTPNRVRESDPEFSLDNAFKVELFWIVSRVNNCQYCIGHQESKLLGAGKSEDEIASLDGDWKEQPEEKRVAFQFAKKFTNQPYLLADQDIQSLQRHYTDLQILEMILSMCGNNSINRWKEAVAVPQRAEEGGYSRMASLGGGRGEPNPNLPRGTYLTPTSSEYEFRISSLFDTTGIDIGRDNLLPTRAESRILESRDDTLKELARASTRQARIPLISPKETVELFPDVSSTMEDVPNWARLLANFPIAGKSRVTSILAAERGGDISALLKAQLAWIAARQDGAWYAAAHAMKTMKDLGLSEDQIFALDGDLKDFPARERSLYVLAKNLAASPVILTTEQVAEAVKCAGPRDTVQAISYICSRASFNRLTEAVGLPVE